MSTGLHKDLGPAEVHVPYSWTYADATERLAATGFLSSDVGKLARQIDDNTLWILTGYSPITWVSTAAGGAPLAHAASHASAGSDAVTLAQSQVTNLTSDLADKLGSGHLSVDTHPRLSNVMSTGLLYGAELSINALDPATFDIAEGAGIIVDSYTDPEHPVRTYVDIEHAEGIELDDMSGEESYIYVDSTGAVIQKHTIPCDNDRRELIYLGWVSHLDNVEIDDTYLEPYDLTDVKNTVYDFLENFGSFNIDGNDYYPNGANLKLGRSSGKTFDACANYQNSRKSPNIVMSNAVTVAGLLYYYHNALGEWVNNSAEVTDIDPDQYDTLTGLAAVPTGKWTIQPIMFYAPWGTTDIQYGQKVYDTYAEARADLYHPVAYNPYNALWDTFRGWLIVKEGATDLTDTDYAVLVSAGKLGLVSASSGGGSGGEQNTASNIGLAGVGLYYDKSGAELQFKNIAPASNKVTTTNNPANKTVDIDIAPGNISHTAIADIGTNTHSQIDTHVGSTSNPHSVTKTQVGLTNVTDDAQLKRVAGDINSFTEKTVPVAADIALIEDSASSYAKKKLQLGNLAALVAPLFGTQFQHEEALSEQTTTASYTQALRLTTPSGLPAGTYRLGWSFEWRLPSAANFFQGRVQLDDATDLMIQYTEPQDPNNWHPVGGSAIMGLTAGVHTFDLDFGTSNALQTARIRRARLELWRVS